MSKQRRSSTTKDNRRKNNDVLSPSKRTPTAAKFEINPITPMTARQEDMFESYYQGLNIMSVGSAGTGKTLCALYLALCDMLTLPEYKRIIIIRSAVQTREQGHMPGDKNQKEALYETPYISIVNELFGRGDAYQILKQKRQLEFKTTSFIRGETYDNAIIIADEVQSFNFHELDTAITRVGESSRIIFCGDTMQDDLKNSRNRSDVSGLIEFLKITERMDSFDLIEFKPEDCVRSGLVREYLMAKEAQHSTQQ